MRKLSVVIFILLVLMLPMQARAQQANITITQISIDFWPEYDRPSMLVVLSLRLPDTQALPLTLQIPVPATAEINAVAKLGLGENLENILGYQTSIEGDWNIITLETDSPYVRIEYYDLLTIEGSQRDYQFDLSLAYDVEHYSLGVQAPVDSYDVALSPFTFLSQSNNAGISYYTAEVEGILAGETLGLHLSYAKDSSRLTQSIETAPPTSTEETSFFDGIDWGSQDMFPYYLGIAGIAVLLFGGYNLLKSSRQIDDQDLSNYARKKKGVSQKRGISQDDQDEDGVYCHSCGSLSYASDKFCRECGSELRL